MLQLQFLNMSKPPLWLVETTYTIGSALDADCVLNVPGMMPQHASLRVDNDLIELSPHSPHTAVNGQKVSRPTPLRHGDTLEVGGVLIAVIDPKLGARTSTAKVDPCLWHLQPMSTALDPKIHDLSGRVIIGRASECDIRLNFSHLSRRHATLTVTPSGLELEDLGSSNGTSVNDIKVRRMLLKNGDILSFDSLKFRILGPEDDLDKTALLPSIAEELYPTHLLQRPVPLEVIRPTQSAPAKITPLVTPRARQPESVRHARTLLLTGIAIVVLLFGSLILFLLH